MLETQISGIFNNVLKFWSNSEFAMFSIIASFALCGVFMARMYLSTKRRKKFSDWRSMKLVAIIPAALATYFSYVTQNYAAIPACLFSLFLGAFVYSVINYTAKNPREFARFLLLPVWLSVQVVLVFRHLVPKKIKA